LTDFGVSWKRTIPRLGASTFHATFSTYQQSREAFGPDLQGISNTSAESFHRWREIYVETAVSKKARIKAGKADANTDLLW